MSANALLERMRKLREERERAAQSSQPSATTTNTNEAAAATATRPAITTTTTTTTTTATTAGSKASETQESAEDVLMHVPPSFMSPTNALLRYRDTVHDPLCVRCTSEAVVELLQHFMSGRAQRKEEEGTEGEEDVEADRPAKRTRNETSSAVTTGNNSPAMRTSPERSAQQVVVDYFAHTIEEMKKAKHPPISSTPPSQLVKPQTLYEDRSYWSAVAAAHVEVSGAVRPMCRDVNHYLRRNRLAHGVYGVVFSATAAAATSKDDKNAQGTMKSNTATTTAIVTCDTSSAGSTSQELFALKQIKKQWLEESQVGFPPYLLREFDLLLRLRHPNIVEAKELVLLDPLPLPGQEEDKEKEKKQEEVEKEAEEDGGEEEKKSDAKAQAAMQDAKQTTTTTADAQKDDNSSSSNNNNKSTATMSKTNVLAAVGMTSKAKDVFLVMEYCCYDLKNYLFRYTRDGQVPFLHLSSRNAHPAARDNLLARIKCIAYQLLRGLAFLHDHRILHRDLKTSNILLSAEGRVKIADFGLGRLYREGQNLTPTVVTLMYRAPELHFGLTDYSHAMDVWSAGCIFAELFLKQPLFRAASETAHLLSVCDVLGIPTEESFPGLYKLPLAKEAMRALSRWNRRGQLAEVFVKASCPDAALLPASGLDLLQRMLRWNPLDRVSAADALTHAFFTEDPPPCAPAELMRPMPFLTREAAAASVAAAAAAAPTVGTKASEPMPTDNETRTATETHNEQSQPGMSSPAGQKTNYVSPTLHPTRRNGTSTTTSVPPTTPLLPASALAAASSPQMAALQARHRRLHREGAEEEEEGNDEDSANQVPAEESESEAEGARVAQQALLRANQDLEEEE